MISLRLEMMSCLLCFLLSGTDLAYSRHLIKTCGMTWRSYSACNPYFALCFTLRFFSNIIRYLDIFESVFHWMVTSVMWSKGFVVTQMWEKQSLAQIGLFSTAEILSLKHPVCCVSSGGQPLDIFFSKYRWPCQLFSENIYEASGVLPGSQFRNVCETVGSSFCDIVLDLVCVWGEWSQGLVTVKHLVSPDLSLDTKI